MENSLPRNMQQQASDGTAEEIVTSSDTAHVNG